MASKGILRTDDRVLPVANDVAKDSPYRAEGHRIDPDGTTAAKRNARSEMLLFVENGTLELMIEGAIGHLSAGEFARIPAGRTYAYRNAGSVNARVLSLPVRQADMAKRTTTITVTVAAA